MTRFTTFFISFILFTLFSVVPVQAFPGANKGDASSASGKPAVQMASVQGKVVETMNVSGYTYLCVEQNGQKSWAAIPESKVEVGSEVTVKPGMVMNNFSSKSLGRTFEAIVFSQGLVKQ